MTYLMVSGDFTPWGGMDRANYELAWHLADRCGASVHLVSHSVAEPLVEHPNVIWHRVPKPLRSYALAGPLLSRKGYRTARILAKLSARVVVNGGNCPWPDVNWVHAVHAAWSYRDSHAPMIVRLRNTWHKHQARRGERQALQAARVVLANSHRVRQQMVTAFGIPSERVHVVYLGIDPAVFRPFTEEERKAARQRLAWPAARRVVVFIGALGHDRNKGFDVLFGAWKQLCKDSAWDVDLAAAGGGAEVPFWRRQAEEAGLGNRIHILGFTKNIPDVLAAADALVSPTYYDAYGLSVHEALCCGLPAFVTRSAGVAERYPDSLADLLLDDPPEAADLAARLQHWRRDQAGYRARVAPFCEILRKRTWADMATDIVNLIEST
jgi:glycosyltransferase involved in cell wall biosynthesis